MLHRASIPPEKRHRVSLFIDELQDYLRLPTSLSDALIQARGLGVSLTLAHQYRHQLTQEIKMAIDANCKNKICLGLDMNDAQDMARQAPELMAEDFYSLPQYHIYTKLHNGGNSTNWLLGKTFAPVPKSRDYADLVAQNTLQFPKLKLKLPNNLAMTNSIQTTKQTKYHQEISVDERK